MPTYMPLPPISLFLIFSTFLSRPAHLSLPKSLYIFSPCTTSPSTKVNVQLHHSQLPTLGRFFCITVHICADPHTFQISESTWRQRTFPSTKTFSQVATGEIFNNCTTTLCQTLLVILTPLGVLFASQVISNPILKSILAPAFSV